jgi:N-glycosidase YbiA
MTVINDFRGPYRWLSNFGLSPMRVFDQILQEEFLVPCVEHGYLADKTLVLAQRRAILEAPKPRIARDLGQKATMRPDWDKLESMKYWLELKFAIPSLRELLLATGDAELIEGNTWGDRYWGICGNVGQNNLGKLLMEIRKNIK